MQVICRRRKLRNVARKANRSEKKNKQISKHLFFILAVFCRCLDAFAISPQHLMLVAGIRSFSVRIGAKAVCVCTGRRARHHQALAGSCMSSQMCFHIRADCLSHCPRRSLRFKPVFSLMIFSEYSLCEGTKTTKRKRRKGRRRRTFFFFFIYLCQAKYFFF